MVLSALCVAIDILLTKNAIFRPQIGSDEIDRKRSERKNRENEESDWRRDEKGEKKKKEGERRKKRYIWSEGRRKRKKRNEFKFKNSNNSLFKFSDNRLFLERNSVRERYLWAFWASSIGVSVALSPSPSVSLSRSQSGMASHPRNPHRTKNEQGVAILVKNKKLPQLLGSRQFHTLSFKIDNSVGVGVGMGVGVGKLSASQFLFSILNTNLLKVPNDDLLFSIKYLKLLNLLINLENNNLTGSIPAVLIDRWNDVCAKIQNLSGNVSCDKKKNRKYNFFVPMMIVSVVALSVLLLSAAAIWCRAASKRKRRLGKIPYLLMSSSSAINNHKQKHGSFERKGRRFTYSEIVQITEEFKRVLGKGGFGTVYHGHIDDTQVAVKMLSPSSVQGFQEFLTEADLLMRVHHRNLTSLVGYCNDETNIVLNLRTSFRLMQMKLLSSRSNILSWGDRVQIAIEAAQGLEYLHYGCSPPIIHRDVKSTNILLNEKFEAKLSDCGISRSFPTEDGTHITTIVAGTPGYLDPKYYASNRLNKESDVYSFGIVLLEIITSRPVFSRTHERSCISEWFSFMLQKGDIYGLVDPRLEGKFNINSVWKAVEIANACVSPTAIERLSMSQVVADLKECLATALARANPRHETEIKDSIAMLHPSLR
ncbi:LRR receptor-like serine/threonine-protein kinase [Pyrus ussuriensis x Pyrus communis]|uniref:LRR receptor-like serine/threonine-protein kinase n=1 Tax=Pyrus ussuriensis x Pyrus communis TaxID=2448454 RepID=A0A5N5FV20_9ROSA|nr:LRR receptor-like serine/threonine-protein kinase [Pyrus ussuriensis x Pyrus communis]